MEVARTSMIHAAAPYFLWPLAVRYVAHQLNLWPRVSLPETSPTQRWTGKVGDASVFRVWGSRAFVRDTSADKLSAPDAPGWQFYHPTSRRVLPSQDVTFDESVPFYHLFPYCFATLPPPPLFLAPSPPPVDPLPPQGPAPSGVSQVDPLPGTVPVEVAGAGSGGAEPGGAQPGVTEPVGAESGGAEPESAEHGGTASGGDEPGGSLSPGGPLGASRRRDPLSTPQLREWFDRRTRLRSGAAGARHSAAGGTGAAGAVGVAGVGARAGGFTRAAGPGGAHTGGTGAARAGGAAGVGPGGTVAGAAGVTGAAGPGSARSGGTGAEGAAGVAVGDTGAGGTGPGGVGAGSGDTGRPRPYFVPLLQQVLGLPSSTALTPPLLCPPVRTGRRVPRPRPPPVPSTHHKALRPSSVPQRVPLPSRPASSLADKPDLESDLARAASPTLPRLLESATASALVTQLIDFAAVCRLDYATSLVAESGSARPPSVGGECALGTDVLEDRQEDFECLAAAEPSLVAMLLAPEGDLDAPDIPTPRSYAEEITGPYSSQWQIAMDAEMASWKSTGTYVNAVLPSRANIVDGMWIFKVKWPPDSPPAFKARYVAQGFSQRQGVDLFRNFSPTLKMTTLRVLLHVAAQHDYELHSLDFSKAFPQGSLHEEIWLRRPPGFTRSFPAGTQWSLRRPLYGLRQAPRDWHDTLRTTLAALGFAPSTADPSLLLRTDTSLPPFYVLVYVDDLVFAIADTEALSLVKSELQKRHICTDLVLQRLGVRYSSPQSTPLPTGHSLLAPPSDESVETSGPYPELVGCLMYLMTCTRPDLAYPLSILACYVVPGRHRPQHWEATKRVLRYLCSTSGMGLMLGGRGPVVISGHADASWVDDLATQRSSSCEAEIYAGAMAAQELRWLTYLLTDLGERPRSSPQRGQLHLAYAATRANTADIFTKTLQSGDYQRFYTVLGLVPTFPHLLTA
ncbi:unnamed protein product [Closterium sp. NIES-53]